MYLSMPFKWCVLAGTSAHVPIGPNENLIRGTTGSPSGGKADAIGPLAVHDIESSIAYITIKEPNKDQPQKKSFSEFSPGLQLMSLLVGAGSWVPS